MAATPEFSGLSNRTDFDQGRAENKAQAQRRIDFAQKFASLNGDDGKPSLDSLRKFVFEDNKPADFQAAELMQVFTAFRRHKGFAEMLRLQSESTDAEFTQAPIVREFCAVACNMTDQYDRTIELCQGLIDDKLANGEVYGALGKAWLKKGDLQKSADAYEAGFTIDFEYYPGINAAYRHLELGNVEKAQSLARMTHLACLRDGVGETMDYWCAATALEAATIMGGRREDIDNILTRIQKMPIEPWQLESTLSMMKRVQGTIAEKGQSTASFDYTIDRLTANIGLLNFKTAAGNTTPAPEPTASAALTAKSFSYRALASNFIGQNFVPGNFRFNGQLPDHCVSRTDWQQFRALIDLPIAKLLDHETARLLPHRLADITDPSEFMQVSDKIIRKAYGTDRDDLEDLMSDGHARFDERVAGLLKLSGIDDRRRADSRTNISVIMGMGLGDCRHHAQAKQQLFDLWQKEQMNDHLAEAYASLQVGDTPGFESSIAAFHDIESVELRTFDMEVMAPMKKDGQNWVADATGTMNLIEEHTMTFLLRKDENNKVQSIRFADSFYQNHYKWGDGEIPLDRIAVDESGRPVLPARTVKTTDPQTGTAVDVPVILRPTPYAGERSQIAGDEYGQLLLMGIPVEKDFNLGALLAQTDAQRLARLDQMRYWYNASGEIPDILRQRGRTAPGVTAPAPPPPA